MYIVKVERHGYEEQKREILEYSVDTWPKYQFNFSPRIISTLSSNGNAQSGFVAVNKTCVNALIHTGWNSIMKWSHNYGRFLMLGWVEFYNFNFCSGFKEGGNIGHFFKIILIIRFKLDMWNILMKYYLCPVSLYKLWSWCIDFLGFNF